MRIATFSFRLLPVLASVALLAGLPACKLLIPENPSSPRYNDVIGGPRSPALNPKGAGMPAATPMAQRQPSGNPGARPMPSGMGMNPSGAPSQMMETDGSGAGAATAALMGVSSRDLPAPGEGEITASSNMPPQMMNGRHAPMENGMPQQFAATTYPDLSTVPPRKEAVRGMESDQQRLDRIRAQLEAERSGAINDKNNLSRDAASEPSLINEPLPQPIAPQSFNNLPPPPAPLMGSDVASASPMEPIMLRPPVGQDMPASAMAPAMAGGFNPMDNGTIQLRAPSRLATNGYLPDSRYTSRRNGGNAAPFSRVQ